MRDVHLEVARGGVGQSRRVEEARRRRIWWALPVGCCSPSSAAGAPRPPLLLALAGARPRVSRPPARAAALPLPLPAPLPARADWRHARQRRLCICAWASGRQLSGSRARHGARAEVRAGRGVGGGGCWEWPGWGGGCAAAAATTVGSIDRHAPRRCLGRARPPSGTACILRSSIPRRAPGGAACGRMAAKARPCQSELDESGLDGAHAGRRGDQQRP